MINKEDKIRMLWTMVGMIQQSTKEPWSEEQVEIFESMEKDFV